MKISILNTWFLGCMALSFLILAGCGKIKVNMLTCKISCPSKVYKEEVFNIGLVIHNAGDNKAADVVTIITLSKDLIFEDGSRKNSWQAGTIPQGGSIFQTWKVKGVGTGKCYIEVTVTSAGTLAAEYDAVAEIVQPDVPDNPSPAPVNPDVAATLPDLAINISAPPIAHLGREFMCNIDVKNIGTCQATGVVVAENLSQGVEFKEASEGGQYKDATRTVEWNIGTLRVGESRTLSLRVKAMQENMEPGWENTAKVTCAGGVTQQSAIVTRVEAVPAVHIDCYDTEDPVQLGDTTVYVMRIENEGQKEATQVYMKVKIPEQSSFVSLEASTCPEAGNVKIEGRYDVATGMAIFTPVPVIRPGESAIYKVQVKAEVVGDVVNTVLVTFAEFSREIFLQEPTKFYK